VKGTPERAIAAIDVGTNTTLLLIARPRTRAEATDGPGEPEVLVEAAEITRLGRGIGQDGGLGREGIDRTLAALERYAREAREHGAKIAAIGTEALRHAPNAAAFLQPAARLLGTPVEVITGEREAALTFRAVAESFPSEVGQGRVIVVDVGGGSTEIIVSEAGAPVFRASLPVGSVRLHERYVRSDPPLPEEARAIERDVESRLGEAASAWASAGTPVKLLIGVAGTVTSLAAMSMQLVTYDSARVHGSVLTLAELDRQIDRLASATQGAREQMVGLDPRRADVIFAGALLLRTIARRAGVDAVRVSDRGIRWGLFYERAAALAPLAG